MWAHYTDAHKGLCIGFDSNEPFFKNFKSIASESKIFLPVIYADERTRIPIEQGKSIDSKVMLTKAKYWEYEQEERLLVSFNEASKKINAKPFDIYLYKVPHGLIREIIAGANISKEFLDEVTKFCNEKTIKLFRSAISETEFSMIRDLV